MDKNLIQELISRIDELENFIDKNLDHETPIWNASHIGYVPIDTKYVKDGWGFLYNNGKFELYPLGESKFFEHDKLSGYDKKEHLPANDSQTSVDNLWTSKKVSKELEGVKSEIKASRTQGNITINKTIKKVKQELLGLIDSNSSANSQNKQDILATIKRLDQVQKDVNIILNPSGLQGALQRDKQAITKISSDLTKIKREIEQKLSTNIKEAKKEVLNSINDDLNSIEFNTVDLVNLKIQKLRTVLYTKGEINKKLKALSDRIAKIKSTTKILKDKERQLTDKELKELIDKRVPYGHKHRAGDVVYNGQSLQDYLDEGGNGLTNPVDVLEFNTTYTPNGEPTGSMYWNDQDGTVDLKLKGGNVTLQLGQETVKRVVNKTGGNLLESEYKAVRIRKVSEGGAQGQRLAVVLAQADSEFDSTDVMGLVTENILVNEEGFVTTEGEVKGINTTGSLQGETWVDGDMLFLSPTVPGGLTKVKPEAPNHLVIVGYVEYAHQTQGKIYVKVDTGYELDELHNVKITSPADKNMLTYNGSTNIWENKPFAVPIFTSAPSSPIAGQMYINSTTGYMNVYYNGNWIQLHSLGVPTESYFLLENGDYLLLENGDKLILG